MRLLRTIRLDPSDGFIFPAAAPAGEWAISAGFLFSDREAGELEGKELAAFRSGFLGLPSLGWSTLAQVVEADAGDREAAIALLARALLERFGAPDAAAARAVATEEIDFAGSLGELPADTLIAVRRRCEGGAIREAFRSLRPRGDGKRWRAFAFDAAEEDGPTDTVDLAALAREAPE